MNKHTELKTDWREATPLPWHVGAGEYDGDQDGNDVFLGVFIDGPTEVEMLNIDNYLAETEQATRDRAAFIVQAVNNHEALVEALESLLVDCAAVGVEPFSAERARSVVSAARGQEAS